MTAGLSQLGSFTNASAREALEQLRDAGGGVLLVTNGLRDLRLSLGQRGATLEGLGYKLHDPPDLVREVLCALFWEDPSYLAEPQATCDPHAGATAVHLDEIPLAQVVSELLQGCQELTELRRKVPGLDAVVTVQGEPPPPEVTDPPAALFRALHEQPGRSGYLLVAAEAAGLDPLDAAWVASDLIDAGQATIKRAPPTTEQRRLKKAETLSDDGFLRGLRLAHLARCTSRTDPRRAAALHRLAGMAYLQEHRPLLAADAFRLCLALQPEDVPSLEGLVDALEQGRQANEARRLRKELSQLYLAAGLPGRARNHLELLGDPGVEAKGQLLDCALQEQDFEGAIELAERLAPQLQPEVRLALVTRFAEAGARGEPLERARGLAGLKSRPGLRRLLFLIALLLVPALLAVGGELYLRTLYHQAAGFSRDDLQAGRFDTLLDPWRDLLALQAQVAPLNLPPELLQLSVLGRVEQVTAELVALRDDRDLLQAEAGVLAWRRRGDIVQASAALDALRARCKSAAGAARVDAAGEELRAYRRQVGEEVERLRGLVLVGNHEAALTLARRLRRDNADAVDVWRKETVGVRVVVRPPEARLTLDGEPLAPLDATRGLWEVRLSLAPDARPKELRVSAQFHVDQRRLLALDPELTAEVEFGLVEVRPLLRAKEPDGEGTGLFVFEEERTLQNARDLSPDKPLSVQDSAALLSDLARALRPGERFCVQIRSEVKLRRVYITSVELYLRDVQGGRQAEARKITILRADRGPREQEGGGLILEDLRCLKNYPVIRAAIAETLAVMQRELG